MCFICADLKEGVIKDYDASLLAVELASVIGQSHSSDILEYLKSKKEKEDSEQEYAEDYIPF